MSDFNDPAGFDLDAGPFDTSTPDHGLPVFDSSPDPIGVDIPHDDSVALLHGSPNAAADDWFEQSAQGYCLPASITQILSEITGHHFSDESVVMNAVEELGIEFSSDGMPFTEGVTLLEHFGVDAELESGLTPSDLQTYLDEGRGIVLGVDAFNIWESADNPVENPEDKMNHALLITGIDQERGFVVLSDPGNPDGNQDVVPMQDFLEAWSDSDYSAIVTTEPTLDTGETDAGVPPATHAGPVLLPVTVNGDHASVQADTESYTVQAGDTLWDIAERVYGDGAQYHRIADASSIANPDLIYPGQVLTIPK
jgi:LysM repeat protein